MAMGYSPLKVEDRCLIQAQLSLCWSPAAIAAGLGRSRSMIPREIARNGWAVGAGGNRVDSQLRRFDDLRSGHRGGAPQNPYPEDRRGRLLRSSAPRGSAASRKTPTACCGSTCPKAPTSAC